MASLEINHLERTRLAVAFVRADVAARDAAAPKRIRLPTVDPAPEDVAQCLQVNGTSCSRIAKTTLRSADGNRTEVVSRRPRMQRHRKSNLAHLFWEPAKPDLATRRRQRKRAKPDASPDRAAADSLVDDMPVKRCRFMLFSMARGVQSEVDGRAEDLPHLPAVRA